MTIEQPINQMKISRSATPSAYGELASHVRVSSRRECRNLLVANANPLNRFLTAQCIEDSVERIADDPVDTLYARLDQSLNQGFRYSRHGSVALSDFRSCVLAGVVLCPSALRCSPVRFTPGGPSI
jgi:hypothetical protein